MESCATRHTSTGPRATMRPREPNAEECKELLEDIRQYHMLGYPNKPEYPEGFREVIETLAELKLVPKRDLMNSTRMFWSVIDSHIQQGSFSTQMFGTLQFPLSAVALESLAEGQMFVLLPGIRCLAALYRQTSRMIIDQYAQLATTSTIGQHGKKKEYAPSDLEGDYTISFKYFTKSKQQRLAGITEAQAVGPLVSDDYKRRELIQMDDPDGDVNKMRDELAEKTDPRIGLYRRVESLIEEDKDIEARLTFNTLKDLLRQGTPVEQPQQAPRPSGGGKPLMPLMGSDKGVGRQPVAEEDKGQEEIEKSERELA